MGFRIFLSIIVLAGISACAQSTQKTGAEAASDPAATATTAENATYSAASAAAKSKKFFDVILDPKEQMGTVKVKSAPQGWNKAGKKNGYVGFAKGESGLVTFIVRHEEPERQCTSEAKKGDKAKKKVEWVISRISVSAYGDSSTEKGSNFNSLQPDWIKEAFPAAPVDKQGELSGHLFEEGPGWPGRTSMGIYNANAQYPEKTVFYEVELRPCDGGDNATTDPMLGNGGRLSP